jgi:hypothetical protein
MNERNGIYTLAYTQPGVIHESIQQLKLKDGIGDLLVTFLFVTENYFRYPQRRFEITSIQLMIVLHILITNTFNLWTQQTVPASQASRIPMFMDNDQI